MNDILAVYADNDITVDREPAQRSLDRFGCSVQTCRRRRTRQRDIADDHALHIIAHAHRLTLLCTQSRTRDPQPAMLVFPIFDQIRHNAARCVCRNSESHTGVTAGFTQNRDIHADYIAITVEQRTTAVARIDRRIGLDQAGDAEAVIVAQAAIQGTDDPGREREFLTERAADRIFLLPNEHVVRIRKLDRVQHHQ